MRQFHDVAVLSLLKTALGNNLKFNPEKMWFKTKECRFFGQQLTPEGMIIDQKKVCAIRKMHALQSEKELKYGELPKQYSSRLTQVAEPLKELLRNYILWFWKSKHQEAFDTFKEELMKIPFWLTLTQRWNTSSRWVQFYYRKIDLSSTCQEH